MSLNFINTKEAGEALGQMLAVNTVLRELDVSGHPTTIRANADGPGFAKGIADGLSANDGALTSLNLASNYLGAEGAKRIAEAIKDHVSALRLDWYTALGSILLLIQLLLFVDIPPPSYYNTTTRGRWCL